MPYVVIEDFRAGLDRRKLPAASPQGSLQTLNNAHITRGGEIEKRLAWVRKYALPAGQTFDLAGANGTLYTFGSAAAPAVPVGITYQQLSAPAAPDMVGVVCTNFFDGKPFVIADYSDGKRYCFYDAARVTDFDAASGAINVQGSRPNFALTHQDKVYCIQQSILAFSAIEEPTHWWDTGTTYAGFGFKNMSNQLAGSEMLTGLGRFQNLMAVFARRTIQIWYLDPDPVQNVQKQTLENMGTYAPRSIVPNGDVDVFFLSDSGVRSIQARFATNQAGMSDVGTSIDDYLLQYIETLSDDDRAAAVGCLEPISGRYMLAIGTRVFVFSYFATSKISAWSTYDLPEKINSFVPMDGRVWARAGDNVYLLGGDDGKTYDNSTVDVDLPYIDARQIATFKAFTALDVVCEGVWDIYVNTDPSVPDAESLVATIDGTTLLKDQLGMVGHSPLLKLRFVNRTDGAARLSKIVVHYQGAEAS